MGDEDKKPRHRLGADELLEETQTAMGKIVNLLESNGLAAESLEHLTSLVKGADFMVRCRTNVRRSEESTMLAKSIRRAAVKPHTTAVVGTVSDVTDNRPCL